MGCWGITAFESDAGLDSVDYIRSNLPKGGKLDLGEIIDALQNDQIRLPDVEFAETTPVQWRWRRSWTRSPYFPDGWG